MLLWTLPLLILGCTIMIRFQAEFCSLSLHRKYNVLDAGEGRGDELYGVEPATFYVKNLFLNTTVAFPLALVLPFLATFLYPLADKVHKCT